MKARVKSTGKIVEVEYVERKTCLGEQVYMAHEGGIIEESRLDFNVEPIDYWTRLEHQAAIAAMQGILSNHNLYGSIIQMTQVSRVAIDYAQELVEKMKEKEERK